MPIGDARNLQSATRHCSREEPRSEPSNLLLHRVVAHSSSRSPVGRVGGAARPRTRLIYVHPEPPHVLPRSPSAFPALDPPRFEHEKAPTTTPTSRNIGRP